MALNLIKDDKDDEPKRERTSYYRDWYEANKNRLASKKAQRYASDVEYRKKALERSKQQRSKKPQLEVTDGYTVPFNDMAHLLGITVWTLREWRKKDYFPEPLRRNGRLWFKEEHKPLLEKLLAFFDAHPRITDVKKPALDDLKNLIAANW